MSVFMVGFTRSMSFPLFYNTQLFYPHVTQQFTEIQYSSVKCSYPSHFPAFQIVVWQIYAAAPKDKK